MPGIPSEDACFFGGTPRNYALTIKEVASYAFDNKIDLYEAMWRKSDDKIEHMPKRLFKFFPFNHNSLKCLETNSVFMNNPKNFNDPFDSLVCSEEKEFLKRTLIDHFENTNAVERGVLTEEELDNLKSCYCEEKNILVFMKLLTVLWADYDMIQANMKCELVKWKYGKYSKMPEINMKQL